MEQRTPHFAFGCGRNRLTGTYDEQLARYGRLSAKRMEMAENGDFNGIEIPEDIQKLGGTPGTQVWLAEMDLVWKALPE